MKKKSREKAPKCPVCNCQGAINPVSKKDEDYGYCWKHFPSGWTPGEMPTRGGEKFKEGVLFARQDLQRLLALIQITSEEDLLDTPGINECLSWDWDVRHKCEIAWEAQS